MNLLCLDIKESINMANECTEVEDKSKRILTWRMSAQKLKTKARQKQENINMANECTEVEDKSKK